MNKNFASNLLSRGSIEQVYLSKNVKTFWGCLIKISVSALNFSTEFVTYYSSLHFILPKVTINIHLKWEISTKADTLRSFSVWDHFYDRSNISEYFFAYKLPYENKSPSSTE